MGQILNRARPGSNLRWPWNGEVVNGLQQGAGIDHGSGGDIDGMKLKMKFWQDPNIICLIILKE